MCDIGSPILCQSDARASPFRKQPFTNEAQRAEYGQNRKYGPAVIARRSDQWLTANDVHERGQT